MQAGGQIFTESHLLSSCPSLILTSVPLDLSLGSDPPYSSPSPLHTQLGFQTILNLQAIIPSLPSTQLPTLWFLHTEVPWSHFHALVEVISSVTPTACGQLES